MKIFSNLLPINNVYLHLPFCQRKCHFCAFPVHILGNQQSLHVSSLMQTYLLQIQKQISTSLKYTSFGTLKSLYLGGGTPSLYTPEQIGALLQFIKQAMTTSNPLETTMQLNLSEIYKMQSFHQYGVNRFSVGVQSFNKVRLKKYNRFVDQDIYQIIATQMSKFRPQNVNYDFILQMDQTINKVIQFVQSYLPQHLTIYMLQVNEGSYIHKYPQQFSDCMPETHEMYHQLSSKLIEMGYDHYQVSSFCRQDATKSYRSLHNSIYWEGTKQFAAYGMGATSLINSHRITRPNSIPKYNQYISAIQKNQDYTDLLHIDYEIDYEQVLKVLLMSKLRTKQGILWLQIKRALQKQPIEYMETVCNQFTTTLFELDSENGNIIDKQFLPKGIRVRVSYGYLFVDEVVFRLLQCLNSQ